MSTDSMTRRETTVAIFSERPGICVRSSFLPNAGYWLAIPIGNMRMQPKGGVSRRAGMAARGRSGLASDVSRRYPPAMFSCPTLQRRWWRPV
jgi:hypothetical protein